MDAKWIELDGRKEKETPKAVLYSFNKTYSGNPEYNRFVWIPKSCLREVERGAFRYTEVKKWFVSANNLWNVIN